MSLLKSIVLAWSILYTSSSAMSSLPTLSRHFPNHALYVDEQSFENSSLTYGVCQKADQPETQERTKQCQIFLENRDSTGQTHTSSCNVTFNAARDNYFVDEKFRVIYFGSDKSIAITWESEERRQSGDRVFNRDILVRFWIVHLANCLVYESNVTIHNEKQNLFNFEPLVVLAYRDSFDVAYFNERSCNEMFCKLTFNAEGNRASGPFPWFHYKPSTNLYLQPIHSSSPSSEHLLIESSEKLPINQISLLKKNEIKILKFFEQSPYAIGYSTTYSMVGVCMEDYMDVSNRIRYSQIKCLQYDLDGNLLLETVKPVKFNNLFLAMYNVQNDRFLLLTKECSSEHCSNENFDYDVTKFNVKGKSSGFLKIKDFRCHHHSMKTNAKFFERKSGEYCLSFMCSPADDTPEDMMYLDFTTKCFNDDDLLL